MYCSTIDDEAMEDGRVDPHPTFSLHVAYPPHLRRHLATSSFPSAHLNPRGCCHLLPWLPHINTLSVVILPYGNRMASRILVDDVRPVSEKSRSWNRYRCYCACAASHTAAYINNLWGYNSNSNHNLNSQSWAYTMTAISTFPIIYNYTLSITTPAA